MIILLILVVVFIVFSTTKLKIHPFLSLLLAAIFFGLFSGLEPLLLVESIETGFGDTLGKIGIVIIVGVMIGAFLENTGGAFAMANVVIKTLGKKRVPSAMAIIGFIVSIPVFVDSGFIILSSLNKALTRKAGLSLAVTAMALALGLLASHAMVPPTPGPIAAAGILGADLGLVIAFGIPVSLLSLIPVLIFAHKMGRNSKLEVELEPENQVWQEDPKHLPHPLKSSLPIVIPLALIMLKSFNNYLDLIRQATYKNVVDFTGTPVIALLIGLAFALLLPKKLNKNMLSEAGWIGKALKDAAIVIMITGAGGAFGKVLQNSGIADLISGHVAIVELGIWLPFLVAAGLKTAQGSSTVAMITTASIIAPLMNDLGLETPLAKALAVLVIGAGSTVVSHANDSFFWIVTRLTGMSVSTGYRLQTIGTGVLGTSAATIIYLISVIFIA